MAGCDVLDYGPTHREPVGHGAGPASDGWQPCTAPGQAWTDPDLVLRWVCTRHRRQLIAVHAAGLAEQVRWQQPGPGHQPGPSKGGDVMSRAQHILAVIVGLITGVLLLESYGAMVEAARAGGRAIPELWPLGTEALALAMEVSVLEAKRLHHRAVLRLSWLLLVASVALSTLLQVAVAPPTLVGYLTAGATPV
jgi:hypothetical protein